MLDTICDAPREMRVCVVYDCLFPHTIGGAERWYRNLAERLAADGHEVTYLTLRQWDRGADPGVAGVDVRAVGPRMSLYASGGRRRIAPPLVFGGGVLAHLLRHGRRYDVIHTASFPYFSLLAAALVRWAGGYRVVVDWHEDWTRYKRWEYLGRLGGTVGWFVQLVCARVPQQAFCFSRLHAGRLRAEGLRGDVTVLPGEYDGPREHAPAREPEPLVVFAGRHIPEKQVSTIPPAIAAARREIPDLRALILGDGPDRRTLIRLVDDLGLNEVIDVPGFVSTETVENAMARALCLLLPSRREGYGMVVIEAASHGTPSIVADGPDNAATELVEVGVNGIVASSTDPPVLAAAISEVRRGGADLRERTRAWFRGAASERSLAKSVAIVGDAYAGGGGRVAQRSSRGGDEAR